ncbi:MAG: DUF4337 family protein [Planctomycetota bacterium]|nr:DUF4337 family protein [Planctomycetota bacterium]
MAIKIPDELKAQAPQTVWGKVLLATPVVMAVLATMLAGLASGEMGKAQYSRSLAAQRQSKAGDQWGFFQAKKFRGASQRSTLDLLDSIGGSASVSLGAIEQAAASLPETAAAQTIKAGLLEAIKSPVAPPALQGALSGSMPEPPGETPMAPSLKALLTSLEELRPDAETAALAARVKDSDVEAAILAARTRANDFDAAMKPANQWIDRVEKLLAGQETIRRAAPAGAGQGDSLYRGFVGARLRYAAARYDTEARLNQALASLFEVQVRLGNLAAERHHARSEQFFYGMLGAQLAVIIATFAVAARKRNLLWSIGAAAGVFAIAFGAYVYLYV